MIQKKAEFDVYFKEEEVKIQKMRKDNEVMLLEIKEKSTTLTNQQKIFAETSIRREKYYESCNEKLSLRAAAIDRADCTGDEFISINIGGILFQTLKSTLVQLSPYFGNLLSDNWSSDKTIKDKDGNIFIDREPEFIQQLINWSRDGMDSKDFREIQHRIYKRDTVLFKVFTRTIEYFGIVCEDECDHEIGSVINVYWRGDVKFFKGEIIEIVDGETIVVKYDDGHVWKYNTEILKKTNRGYCHYKKATLIYNCQ